MTPHNAIPEGGEIEAIRARDARRGELQPPPKLMGAADDAIRGDTDQQVMRDRRYLLFAYDRLREELDALVENRRQTIESMRATRDGILRELAKSEAALTAANERVAELERERDDARDNLMRTTEFNAKAKEGEPLELSAKFQGEAIKAWAHAMVGCFKEGGATNYLVCELIDPNTRARYEVTMQKLGGKTVAQAMNEFRNERDALAADARRYQLLREGAPGTPFYVADSSNEWNAVVGAVLDRVCDSAIDSGNGANACEPIPTPGEQSR